MSGAAHSGADHPEVGDFHAPQSFYDGAVSFSTDEAAAQYGADYWNGCAESLPRDEQSAFEHYSMEPSVPPSPSDKPTYVEINGALRGGGSVPAEVLNHIRLMDEALAGRPTPETIIVTRGTGLSHIPESPDLMLGNTYSDPAYMSTSLGSPAFSGMEATLHLRVPPGTPALYLEKVSVFGNSERELLLGRGVAYKVESAAEVDGHWHVYGEVVK